MTQTTKTLIVLIVALTILAGISIIFAALNPESTKQTQRKPIAPNNTENSINAFINLLKSQKDQKCTLTANIKNIPIKGNIYVSNGSMKGEFKPEYFPADIRGNLIIYSDTIYIWTNLEKDGYKSPIASNLNSINNNSIISELTESMKLSCTSWRSDPQVFDIPENIIFRDENSPSSPSANYLN